MSNFISQLFEPFFVVMLAGILVIIWSERKHSSVFSHNKLLMGFLLFMIAWRLLLKADSSRYWAATLIPGLYYGAIFCWTSRFSRKFTYLVVTVLLVVAIGRELHFNRYRFFIQNAAQAIVADTQKYQKSFIINLSRTVGGRLEYYSEIPTIRYNSLSPDELYDELYAARALYTVAYLAFDVDNHMDWREILPIDKLGAKLIFEEFHNNRQRKKLYVYRIELPELPILTGKGQMFFPNGDFELTDGITPLMRWSINYGAGIPLPCITTERAINGKRSLQLQYGSPATLFSENQIQVSQNGILTFKIKNARNTRLTVYINVHAHKQFGKRSKMIFSLPISDNDEYLFQIPLRVSDYTSEEKINLYWSYISPDGFQFDDVVFYPTEDIPPNIFMMNSK